MNLLLVQDDVGTWAAPVLDSDACPHCGTLRLRTAPGIVLACVNCACPAYNLPDGG